MDAQCELRYRRWVDHQFLLDAVYFGEAVNEHTLDSGESTVLHKISYQKKNQLLANLFYLKFI